MRKTNKSPMAALPPVVQTFEIKVVECFDADVETWKGLVQAACDELPSGGVLYTTLSKQALQEFGLDAVGFLKERFAEVGPLNVGTNPHLSNNDASTLGGFLCVR